MILKKDIDIVEVAGDFLAIPTGENMAKFGGAVVLNEVSAFLLREMKDQPRTKEQLLSCMLAEYDVDRATAEKDLTEVMRTFVETGLTEE